MSTPSTATAPLPPHHAHYLYAHRQGYQTNAGQHATNDFSLNGSSRLTQAYTSNSYPNLSTSTSRTPAISSKQIPPSAAMTTLQSTPTLLQPKRERKPDWHEFYKNGPPKEIIVIDDDSPPPQQRPESRIRTQNAKAVLNNSLVSEHANKKRKTGYDTGSVRHEASYSNTHTPHYMGSGSDTISTDRTTSQQTTAPTSLGSHGSGGSSGVYVETGNVGQKRKRITRQTTADEKKRREIEAVGDAYSFYVPPPKPPIKAKDVYVQPVKDVKTSHLQRQRNVANDVIQVLPHQQKIDDDDGHFVVLENTDLTERCK